MIATREWVKSLLSKLNIGKYSTDEIRVGTWIDGKPIYQKTFKITNPTTGGKDVTYDMGIGTIGTMVNIKYTLHALQNSNFYDISGNWYWTSTGNNHYVIYNATDKKIHYLIGSDWASNANNYIIFTVQYTK